MKGSVMMTGLHLRKVKIFLIDFLSVAIQTNVIITEVPFGQLPTLETRGVTICQSIAIARFVAKEVGLDGKDSITTARADMVVDSITDYMNGINESIT